MVDKPKETADEKEVTALKSIKIEEKIIEFYSTAAEQSKSLLADVPRVFTLIAKKRDNRKSIVKSLWDKNNN